MVAHLPACHSPVQECCTSAIAARGLHSLLTLEVFVLEICLYFSRHFSAINLCISSISITKILESFREIKMFRTTLATCSNLDAARTALGAAAVRNIVSRKSCTRVVMAARFSTRSRQLELVHPRKLASGVPSKCAPFLLPVRASSIVATRLYATDNERKPSSTEGDTKSQSILTRLLEEDQQQPKAVTVAERGIHLLWLPASKTVIYFYSRSSRKRYYLFPHHLHWIWYYCDLTLFCLRRALLF